MRALVLKGQVHYTRDNFVQQAQAAACACKAIDFQWLDPSDMTYLKKNESRNIDFT